MPSQLKTIPRIALTQKLLSAISEKPLVVVNAPMGYGKTTVVQQLLTFTKNKELDWTRSSPDRDAAKSGVDSKKPPQTPPKRLSYYMKLNPGECSPEHLLGLHQYFLSDDVSPLSQIVKDYPVLTTLDERNRILAKVKEITSTTPILVVIDDYHYVTDPRFHTFFERVVKANITGLSLLIISRTIPDLPLVELNVKGLCQSFGVDALAFDEAETRAFFQVNRLDDEELIKTGWAFSEGWPAALRLYAQQWQRNKQPIDDSIFYSLFDSAFFSSCSEEEKIMLLKLSIFEEFSSQTAAEFLGLNQAGEILRAMIDRGAFLSYSAKTKTFKFHNLFRSFCAAELQGLPQATLNKNALYRKAAECLLSDDRPSQTLDFLLQAGRDEDLKFLLELFENPLLQKSILDDRYDLGPLVKKLSWTIRASHPLGHLGLILAYGLSVGRKIALELLNDAMKHFSGLFCNEPKLKTELAAHSDFVRAVFNFQRLTSSLNILDEVKKALGSQAVKLSPPSSWTFGSPHAGFIYLSKPGEYLSMVEELGRSWPDYLSLANCWGLGGPKLMAAERELERGDFEQAEILANEAAAEAKCGGGQDILIGCTFLSLRVALASRRAYRALELLKDFPGEQLNPQSTLNDRTANLVWGYINSILGLVERLPASDENEQAACDAPWEWWGHEALSRVIQARTLLWQLNYSKLLGVARFLKQHFQGPPNMLMGRLHATILEAIALWNLQGPRPGLNALNEAMELAFPDHLVLIFAEHGKHITPLLKLFLAEQPGQEVRSLATQAYQLALNYESLATNHVPGKIRVKKLTMRELRFLDQVILGRSNREIAELYKVQTITVTKALSNAYRKLGVQNRSQAIRHMLSND
jgi:LuxR family maltose regulon positive regulatory protein